ncbi:PREDICTED: uncharacterized protein LOC106745382 [Dinoponera quadriceps]|uniref:Coiled-coil domain-containing protein 167 n=1 Tax=Dinoponera quadriceps TaxID=609295 RepID=A0A6P3XEY4_DINQU|nr:PREDICTED: uncharacterized protein LOC106745382 [Dinoponera quadriceps]
MTRTDDTVINKIKHVEDSLKNTLHRVEMIEKKLRTRLLTTENRERLENELEDVKEVLRRNEEKLQSLRKENSKSFMVAACLVFLCFLFYGVYMMISENI